MKLNEKGKQKKEQYGKQPSLDFLRLESCVKSVRIVKTSYISVF